MWNLSVLFLYGVVFLIGCVLISEFGRNVWMLLIIMVMLFFILLVIVLVMSLLLLSVFFSDSYDVRCFVLLCDRIVLL